MERGNPRNGDRPVSTWMLVGATLIAAILVLLLVFDLVSEGRISGVFGAVAIIYALLYITLIKQYLRPPTPIPPDDDEDEPESREGAPE